MKHSIKERMYVSLLLNRLFTHLVPEGTPQSKRNEIAFEWLSEIRKVDGLMLVVRLNKDEPFCAAAHRNNYECFDENVQDVN